MSAKNADFSFIRYANCWEDADLLTHNLRPQAGARVLSIASAGDNSFAFLAFDPSEVIAFDINPTQLFLSELKQKAIEHLQYDEVLEFLGFTDSSNRLDYFKRISNSLGMETRAYFETHIQLIQSGVIYSGKFEKYFSKFRTYVLPLIHTENTINKLFESRDTRGQELFYHKVWNNRRWQWMFKLFFSKFVMGKFGRDPSFFNEVKLAVGEEIYQRAESHLSSLNVQHNHFLDFQLRGRFSVRLPYYLLPENFDKIKKNIKKIKWVKGYLTDISIDNKFDLINLSNIFEYMNPVLFKVQSDYLLNLTKEGSRVAYWNLLVDRELETLEPKFKKETITGIDLCFFYHSFHLNQRV